VQVQRVRLDDVQRLGGAAGVARSLRSLVPAGAEVEDSVRAILADVRTRGDEAVLDYTRRFESARAGLDGLVVSAQELDEAMAKLTAEVYSGLEMAIANVAQVAAAGVQEDVSVPLPQGQQVILREVPVSSAAVYVPGGRAPYPSTVVMGTVTARAAGVLDVAVCAPPGRDGHVDATILAACRLCGVSRVYRMGGAQAVAALAHGTDTVERVDVIVGPGNLYVQEAKRQLSGVVGIDGFAGPSDLLVIFDEQADPGLVALDLLAQAEHGEGTLVGAISTSASALDVLARRIVDIVGESTSAVTPAACVLVHVAEPREAIGVANAFAPEHLELIGAAAEALAPLVQSAGCLFVGASSATAFGDYVAGSNHVLPTAGAARFASGLSTRHFRRRMAEVRIGDEAAAALAPAGAAIALSECFPFHASSMRARAGMAAAGEPQTVAETDALGRPGADADEPAAEEAGGRERGDADGPGESSLQ
jgi:histidinol dehydrogenase